MSIGKLGMLALLFGTAAFVFVVIPLTSGV